MNESDSRLSKQQPTQCLTCEGNRCMVISRHLRSPVLTAIRANRGEHALYLVTDRISKPEHNTLSRSVSLDIRVAIPENCELPVIFTDGVTDMPLCDRYGSFLKANRLRNTIDLRCQFIVPYSGETPYVFSGLFMYDPIRINIQDI